MFSTVSQTAILLLAFTISHCTAQSFHGAEDPRIRTALTLEHPVNGVSTTPGGRLFILYARIDGSKGPQVAEYDRTTNTSTPYPNAEWNSYTATSDPATHLIRTNSQRIGPDGHLWLVDTGSPAFGAPVILPNGPKLVVINLATNKVSHIYSLGNATLSTSLIDDVRFNPASNMAYVTDAGAPAIILLNLATGDTRRVLVEDPSTSAYMPISAEGKLVHTSAGAFERIYADQHEVSPDGKWYYYQPSNGGLSRIQTKYLDQAFHNATLAQELGQYRQPYAHTPSTGGTAIDAHGNIYVSDTDSQRIVRVWPNGTMTLLVQDPRLLWVDAMWVDTQQKLWMPAAQLNRGTPFNNGTSYVVPPLHVFTIELGIGPSPVDHA
ncbi:hypothetical protein LTR08_007090 [Meristemomyces frigidus]|nr:hypothetical protein LTR08_007090 [Meristemomyces frigidus]